MKKVILALAVLAFVGTFTSCQEDNDGVYKPGKKIATITTTYGDNTERTDVETWSWNGKVLEAVYYVYEDGDKDTALYTYDGKQLQKVSSPSGKDYYTVTYDGKKASKIEAYSGTELQMSAELVYDGKKLSSVTMSYPQNEPSDDDWKSIRRSYTYKALCCVLPTNAVETILSQRAKMQNKGAKGMTTMTATLTWDGKNLKSMAIPYKYDSYTMNMSYTYTYDDKTNPFHDFLGTAIGMDFAGYCSANNVLTATDAMSIAEMPGFDQTSTENYTYEYDGKYPTKVTRVEKGENGEANNSTTVTAYTYL